MAEEVQKKLLIKKNIFRRLQKESKFYENEIDELTLLIEKMEKEDPNNYEINKKKEMLEESNQTLIVVKVKTQDAEEELYNFIEQHLEDGSITRELIEDL